MSLKPNMEQYRIAAIQRHGATVNVPSEAVTSYGDDPGAYVEAELEFGLDSGKTDDDWRNLAREQFGRDGELEVDEDPVVITDNLTIVKVWVWVDEDEAGQVETNPPTPKIGTELKAGELYRCPDCSVIKCHTREDHKIADKKSVQIACGMCGLKTVLKSNKVQTLEPSTDVDPTGDINEH